jgi:hypothetical protein
LILLRLTRHVASIVTLIAGSGVCGLAQPSKQVPQVEEKQQQPASDAQRSTPPINVTVQIPAPDPQIAKDEAQDRKANLAIQETIGKATIWIAIIALVQGIASILAFSASNKAAKAAQASADIAKTQAGVAMYAVEHADRPWLKVTPTIGLDSIQEGEVRFNLELLIENVGRSAAQYVQIVTGLIRWKPALDQRAEENSIINNPNLKDTRQDVILPTDSLSRRVGMRMEWDTESEATGDDASEIRLAIIGAVRYTHGQSTSGVKLPVSHATLFQGEIVCRRDGLNHRIPITVDFRKKWPYDYHFVIEPMPEWRSYAD